ncbi:hypothetical protein ST42_11925 [Prevotella pectinovora]|uniref:Uncharacterized protein n=1 Tax=Prevotella pectinovora TaxID=1602169 RepID=A0A0D0I7U3_9BACT|nr:hypothetical protein [Prevotella pectinovora]KIP54361.1 hypothetical protein ST42_11925 [Prevotella pectinovora]KIP64467.1 hypothetical protein ST44_02190 [Prevotella pectinovora]
MDSRIKDLGKDQRIALARIVYDLIMADKIIDDEEVVKFAKLFGEENNRILFHQAQELTFAKAIKLLTQPSDDNNDNEVIRKVHADQRRRQAEKAANIVSETASSDGFCAPAEAILLLAIDYFLKKNNATYTKYDIQSFKLTDIFIGKRFVLYVDNNASSKSLEVEQNYDLIVNLLASIGFQFIYIPKIVEQYKKKGLEMFKAMSMYIFPDIPEDKVEDVYNNIMQMDTKSFVKDYLNEKLGFDIICARPSLMVMLGRSSVIGKNISDKGLVYETNANFLKINIGEEKVVNVVGDLIHDFNKFVTFNFHIDFNPAKDKLLYHGIHKAFFRMVALAKNNPQQYNINISTNLHAVFINDYKLPLAKGKTAIYIMILCRSFFGDKKGLPMKKVFKTLEVEDQERLQTQYEWICAHLSNNQEVTQLSPLYPNVVNRISEIRNAIEDVVGSRLIGEIQIGTGDYITTIVSPDRVTVNGIPIKEHPDWGTFM